MTVEPSSVAMLSVLSGFATGIFCPASIRMFAADRLAPHTFWDVLRREIARIDRDSG
jgi:hypothetical protein